jgi:hypothetical protein
MDIITRLTALNEQLMQSLKLYKVNGLALAEAEKAYKILLRQEALKLRDEGMAIGMIDKTVYGIPTVAEARFKRDCAEAVYKANAEAINTYKLQIRITESQIAREWGANDQ